MVATPNIPWEVDHASGVTFDKGRAILVASCGQWSHDLKPEELAPRMAAADAKYRETNAHQQLVNVLEQVVLAEAELGDCDAKIVAAEQLLTNQALAGVLPSDDELQALLADRETIQRKLELFKNALRQQEKLAHEAFTTNRREAGQADRRAASEDREAILNELSAALTPLLNRLAVNRHQLAMAPGDDPNAARAAVGHNLASLSADERRAAFERLRKELGE